MRSLIVLWLLLNTSVFAQTIIDPSDYKFPQLEGLTATIASVSVHPPSEAKFEDFKLSLTGRKVQSFRTADNFDVRYIAPENTDSTKLIFFLSGIGGDVKGRQSSYYAHRLSLDGYHVIILPSAFSSLFSVAISSTGVVGRTAKDTDDFYRLMKASKNYVESKKKVNFSEINMLGVSLGAIYAGFLAELDNRKKHFNFNRVLMVNTPVDLLYGMRTLDRFVEEKLTFFKELKLLLEWVVEILKVLGQDFNDAVYEKFAGKLKKLSSSEKMLFIGKALSGSLPKVIRSSQDVLVHDHDRDLGLLGKAWTKRTLIRTPRSKRQQVRRQINRERKILAAKKNFEDYLNHCMLGYIKEFEGDNTMTPEGLNEMNSLTYHENFFSNAEHVYVFHNKDDFLLEGGDDLEFLKRAFKDRFTLYPRGGHLGNLWYKDNFERALRVLRGEL